MADVQAQIEELWEKRAELSAGDEDAFAAVKEAIDLLDTGQARVAEVDGRGEVTVHQWLKQSILLLFKLARMETIELGPFEFADKIPLKHHYEAAGVRVVPGASARWGSFHERGVILMPSYTNIGAGLWKAHAELQETSAGGHARPNAFRMVVLMTDGLANWNNGSYNEAAARQDLLNAAAECAADGIPVVTIALGAEADTALMAQVAESTGGRTFVIPGGQTASQYTEDLTEVFKAIADSRPLRLVQ